MTQKCNGGIGIVWYGMRGKGWYGMVCDDVTCCGIKWDDVEWCGMMWNGVRWCEMVWDVV